MIDKVNSLKSGQSIASSYKSNKKVELKSEKVEIPKATPSKTRIPKKIDIKKASEYTKIQQKQSFTKVKVKKQDAFDTYADHVKEYKKNRIKTRFDLML